MIRINLLPQKKSRASDAGQQTLLIGVGAVAAAAAAVFFLIHAPMQSEIAGKKRVNAELARKNKQLKQKTKDFEKLKAANAAEQQRLAAIAQLDAARSGPAWLLYELSSILTRDRTPAMTDAMARVVAGNSNRQWIDGWDPKHVWLTKFEEKKGRFRLHGAAQSDSDMTQLALRLQASMFFEDVLPQTGKEVINKSGGVSYYNFVITGNVVY